MRKVYLDHAATTPVREEVLEAMLPYFSQQFGNPSSIHGYGREIRKVVEDAREKCRELLSISSGDIYFTSGGTEADNIAILGAAEALGKKGNHIITSAVEHHAVLDTCKFLEKKGYKVTVLPVDQDGLISPDSLAQAVTDKTILITVMHANNEVGTIQPIQELAAVARQHGVLFHSDGVQAVGQIPINMDELGVDMYTISGHKIYGPKGMGALYLRKGAKVRALSHGGAQEGRVRPGTENVPGIIGLTRALEFAVAEQQQLAEKLLPLRQKLITGLTALSDVTLNGHPRLRLPNNVNISVDRVEGESLILSLDMAGIAVSSGSACTSGELEPSHVLMAMGLDHQTAHGSLRMTMGRSTSEQDIDYVLDVVPGIIERLRDMSPLKGEGGKKSVQ